MRYFLIVSVALLLSTPCLAGSYSSPVHDRVKAYFDGADEPSVFEAVWFNQNFLRLTRRLDGGRQDGFAQYVCSVLQTDFRMKNRITVEVIDVIKLVQSKKWEIIGRAICR